MEAIPDPQAGGQTRIELRHELDSAYWCRLFDVSHAELRYAIQHVGPQAAAVRRFLDDARLHAKGLQPASA
jgi:hypothetical protein